MQIYTLHDINTAEFFLTNIAVKSAIVNRGGKTFIRRAYQRGINKSATTEAFERLVKSTVNNEAIPTRKELAKEVGVMTKDFLKNPVQFIKEGKQREQLAREFVESQLGIKLPSNKELLKQARDNIGGKLKNWLVKSGNKEQFKDLAVNTSGFIGSKVGGIAGAATTGGVAKLPGQLAGDYAGAAIARKAINDTSALKSALLKLHGDEAFKSASRLQKAKMIHKESLFAMKQRAEYIADKATEDIGGWAIGNAVAETVPIKLPFKGAIVAMPNVGHVVDARKRLIAGENALKVGRDTVGNIAKDTVMIPQRVYKQAKRATVGNYVKGNKRERALRESASGYIKQKKRQLGITQI